MKIMVMMLAVGTLLTGNGALKDLGFRGTSDKPAIEYRVGEDIVFTVTAVDRSQKCAPLAGVKLAWTVEKDGGGKENGEAVSASNGVKIVTRMDFPGFLHLTVKAFGPDGKEVSGPWAHYEASAGADVNHIASSLPPSDFDRFWATEIGKMESLPLESRLEEIPSKDPSVAVRKFSVTLWPGEGPATGLIAWPTNAAPKSLPMFVDVPGYGYGSLSVNYARVKQGAIQLNITRYGEDPVGTKEYHENLWTNVCLYYAFHHNESHKSSDMFKMLMRDVQAVRMAKRLPEWNGKELTVGGGSMGGYRSLALCALDHDFTSCNAQYAWMCDLNGWDQFGRLQGWLPEGTPMMRYVDGINLARRIKCPVKMFSGLVDYVCPPSGLVIVYNNLRCEKEIRFSQSGGHGCNYAIGPVGEWTYKGALPETAAKLEHPWSVTLGEIRSNLPHWMTLTGQTPVDSGAKKVANPPKDMKLVLLIGQSNMAGRVKPNWDDNRFIDRALMLDRNGNWVKAKAPLHFDRPNAGYGPANEFIRRYLYDHGDVTLGIVPCAVGGSSSATWSPEERRDCPDVGANFRRALAAAKKAKANGEFIAILWHQGEADHGPMKQDPSQLKRYSDRITAMAEAFRKELGCPECPFLIGELGCLAYTGYKAVNPALRRAAARTPHALIVPAEDLTGCLDDKVHFDREAAKTLGSRYYDAWKLLAE